MFLPLLEGLTPEQKAELETLGITRAKRSDWKHGRRKPTAAQLMVLATITKTDPLPLLFWLAEEEANPAQRDLFRRVKERGSWAALTLVLTVLAFAPDSSFASVHRGSELLASAAHTTHCHINDHLRRRPRGLAPG